MRIRTLASAALLSAGLMPAPAIAQQHSAEAVTSAILAGFVARDVSMIAPHSNEQNAEFFADLLSGVEDQSEVWEGTRSEAAITWDGLILPARYTASGNALVPFAIEGPDGPASLTSGVEGRYMSIVLSLDGPDDTTWGFEDINYTDRASYAALGETR